MRRSNKKHQTASIDSLIWGSQPREITAISAFIIIIIIIIWNINL